VGRPPTKGEVVSGRFVAVQIAAPTPSIGAPRVQIRCGPGYPSPRMLHLVVRSVDRTEDRTSHLKDVRDIALLLHGHNLSPACASERGTPDR
jgi:hypothetical protein